MPAVRIICPACGAGLTTAEAFAPGKLVDCPRCRLLFAPTAEDIVNARGEGISLERAWSDDPTVRHPSPSPYTWRRRYRRLTDGELGAVLIACTVMTVLAGVVVGTYLLYVSGSRPASAPTPVAAPTRPPATEPPPAVPAREVPPTVEVEDDRPPPRKPVPTVDDPP
jgi:hypothetical protein